MNEYWERFFRLRMKLICESIKTNNDFDSEAINAEVRRQLGDPPQEKEKRTVQPELNKIWQEIDNDWAARHKTVAADVLGVIKK